jgi:Skp family chaperone for outer membrane proteins
MVRWLTFWLALLGSTAQAQEFPVFQAANVLIVSRDDLFNNSALGKDILQREQDERDKLIEEGRRIGEELSAEELRLTEQRDSMDPKDFKVLADAFDAKVVATRARQDTADSNLIANNEARRRAFFVAVAPILAKVMQRYNATMIIDRQNVLLFSRNLDITREAIVLLDKAYADNPDMINQLGSQNDGPQN